MVMMKNIDKNIAVRFNFFALVNAKIINNVEIRIFPKNSMVITTKYKNRMIINLFFTFI